MRFRLYPTNLEDTLTRARAGLVTAACLGLSAAIAFIVLFWIFSGSLEDVETPFIAAAFILLLLGNAALARRGRVTLATWLLVGLLMVLLILDVGSYGVGSPSSAGFVIPIVLAACGLGLWPGLGMAALGSATVWVVAWGETTGCWYGAPAPMDHLTFSAPALTIIFALCGLIVGFWSQALAKRE
jgi:hypothetical protein